MKNDNLSHSILLSCIYKQSIEKSKKTAFVDGYKSISYEELWDNINKSASYLKSLGLKKNDSIILGAKKEFEFVYIYFAAHMIGVVNVVVDQATTRDKLEYIIDIVKPRFAFGLSNFEKKDIKTIQFSEVNIDNIADEELELDKVKINENDTADIMFTTGTTGNPKGVCLSHYNIAWSALHMNSFIKNTSEDVEVLCLPLSHSFGLGRIRCNLIIGATLVLLGSFANLKLFFNTIETYNVTGFGMVPAVWDYIKKLSGEKIAKYAHQIHYIEIGGAPMAISEKNELLRIFPETRLCMYYGLTEASRSVFMDFHDYRDNLETIGLPVADDVEIKICDELGVEVPVGVHGEICLVGNMVMNRYFLEKENKVAFWGKYFRTGDFGYKDKNGLYYMVGRKKELINIGGKKVSPITIEEAIKSLGVSDCVCVPIKDPKGVLGEVAKAFILKNGCDLTFDEIKTKLSGLLETHEIPVEYEWINKVPKTSSGKIQRLSLIGK